MQGSTFFPGEYLFTRNKVLPGVLTSWAISTGEYLFPGKYALGSTYLREYFFTVTAALLRITQKSMKI